jgi:diadenosine tetraphosphate (Ap4A) HIT family hydrolase
MSNDFALHKRLAADTITLADWPLCRVLLINDANYPWLILVPRRAGLTEFHEVAADDRSTLFDEISRASLALTSGFKPDKINVGALGNIVAQLHVHVVARRRGDAAWPGPVWGAGTPEPYGDDDRARLLDALNAALPDLVQAK